MFEESVTSKKVNSITAKEFVLKYMIYLPFFIVSIAICVFIAFLYVRYKVPKYHSSISILIKDDGKNGSSDALLEGLGMPKRKPNLANEIQILKSAPLMQRVVDSLHLNVQYFFNGKVRRTELYKITDFAFIPLTTLDSGKAVIFKVQFNSKGEFRVTGTETWSYNGVLNFVNGKGRLEVRAGARFNENSEYTIIWQSPYNAAKYFAASLQVSPMSKEASILNIAFQRRFPQKGEDILNELSAAYNERTH